MLRQGIREHGGVHWAISLMIDAWDVKIIGVHGGGILLIFFEVLPFTLCPTMDYHGPSTPQNK